MKVVFSGRARRRVELVARWWRKHRSDAPDAFESELAEAMGRLAEGPTFGLVYATVGGEAIRRMLLPKSEQHLYFVVDSTRELVTVLTVWGARRGRQPKFS